MRAFIALIFLASSTATCTAEIISISPGKEGETKTSRLYSVDYKCDVREQKVIDIAVNALGGVQTAFAAGTINENITIYTQGASVAPGTAFAPSDVAFSTNVLMQTIHPLFDVFTPTGQPSFSKCSGQFFIDGSKNHYVDASVGLDTANKATDLVSKFSALAKSVVTGAYGLLKGNPPPEFSSSVDAAGKIFQDYNDFKKIFEVDGKLLAKPTPLKLQVGDNFVYAYGPDKSIVSTVKFTVKPVTSLVADGHTKFIADYNLSATGQAIDLSAVPYDQMPDKCTVEAMKYYGGGIIDDRDVAYLLYRRLVLLHNGHQNMAQCMGDQIARAALMIEKYMPKLAADYVIAKPDIENIVGPRKSDQPHDRPTLQADVDQIIDRLATHLQGTGLRGDDLTALTGHFASSVNVQDTVRDYPIMKALFNDETNTNKDGSPSDLFKALKDAGLQRWLCVQRTKKDKDASLPLYNSSIDAAVMVIAAKAGANDILDFEKTTLYGVYMKFVPTNYNKPLVVDKLVFENHVRDILLKENPACVKNTPTSSNPDDATPTQKPSANAGSGGDGAQKEKAKKGS